MQMVDTTGRDHSRFGMSVNQSADVHAAGGKNSNVRAAHTVDGDVERLPPVYVQNKLQIRDKGALREKLRISFY